MTVFYSKTNPCSWMGSFDVTNGSDLEQTEFREIWG